MMQIEEMVQHIARLSAERKQAVGDLEARIKALQTQVDVLVAPLDAQLQALKEALTEHLRTTGAGKTSLKTDHFTYSFYYKEDIDKERLKAMAVEIPQIQQCFVSKPQARLLLR